MYACSHLQVSRDNNRMGQDYRLNFRLNKACESDVNKLCANMCSSSPGTTCGGLVLQCLQVRTGEGEQMAGRWRAGGLETAADITSRQPDLPSQSSSP